MKVWRFQHVPKLMETLCKEELFRVRCGIHSFKDIRKRAKVTYDGAHRLEFILMTTSRDYVVFVKAQHYNKTGKMEVHKTLLGIEDAKAVMEVLYGTT